jgi:hypothetical protein
MFKVISRPTGGLTAAERAGLMRVVSEAFDLDAPIDHVMNLYISTVPRVLLAYDDSRLIGFQFFQICRVDGVNVCHFSLAGKSPTYPSSGLQRAFGIRLIRLSLGRMLNPFGRVAIAGVSNSPKSYRNMLLIGGSVFPDVIRPDRPCEYPQLYAHVARRLNLSDLDLSTGVIRGRMASIGLRMKGAAFERRDDAITRGFMKVIDGDTDNGIFTLVVSTPLAAVTSVAARQLFGARELGPEIAA